MSKHDEAISEGASPEAVTPSIEVGEMVEVLEGLEAGARLQSTHVMPADASRSAKEIADHYQKIRSLLLSLDAERGRLREALKVAEAVLSNVPYEFSTTNGGRIPVTKASEARDIARSALPASDEK